MANEKRLIIPDELIAEIEILYQKHYVHSYDKTVHDIFNAIRRRIRKCSIVNAVPVDEIRLHHILIDENGVPEVKLQFGERVLILRREDDPVDVVEVVHAEWLDIRFDPMWKSMLATCSHCGVRGEVRVKANECGFAVPDSEYCPNCGAKMDGGSD